MKNVIKRRLLEKFYQQPIQSSETGFPGYKGTSIQKANDYWLRKSIGTKTPPLEYMRGKKPLPKEPYRIPKGSEIPQNKRGWLFKKI